VEFHCAAFRIHSSTSTGTRGRASCRGPRSTYSSLSLSVPLSVPLPLSVAPPSSLALSPSLALPSSLAGASSQGRPPRTVAGIRPVLRCRGAGARGTDCKPDDCAIAA
jgi:hypothetical protein